MERTMSDHGFAIKQTLMGDVTKYEIFFVLIYEEKERERRKNTIVNKEKRNLG